TPGLQHRLAGRHDGLQQRHVVAQRFTKATGLDEIALHVDDHQRGVRQLEIKGEGLGGYLHGQWPPPMCAPRTWRSAWAAGVSNTMRPSLITTIRSASSSNSSRSSLISSTAPPWSRTPRRRVWISLTAEMSRPNTGLAAISTLMSPCNSRASTARCALPPERLRMGAFSPWVLMP